MKTTDPDRIKITIETSNNLLNEIHSGDADHGVSIAHMLLSEGPNFDPCLLVILVEAIVELSKIAGSDDAKKFLQETWPITKRRHLIRLQNRIKETGSD